MINLDQLEKPGEKIIFNGQEIEIRYPSMLQLGKMMSLGTSMQGGNPEEVLKSANELNSLFRELIPELGDYELNPSQIEALVGLFGRVSVPEEIQGGEDTKKNPT